MDVAMMQPAFLPWQGFFELIYKSDKFIFLDDFQFSVQSYHQRNRLFINKEQVDWYSIPVNKQNSFKAPLNHACINDNVPWRQKTWKRFDANYGKAPYFDILKPFLKEWLFTNYDSLAAQNIVFIKHVCSLLGIQRHFYLSSNYSSTESRSTRVLELLNWCGATKYYSAQGSFQYMLEDEVFPVKHIDLAFQCFMAQPYPQIGSPRQFIPNLSILDSLLNIGPEQTFELVSTGTKNWLSWDEMKNITAAKEGEVL